MRNGSWECDLAFNITCTFETGADAFYFNVDFNPRQYFFSSFFSTIAVFSSVDVGCPLYPAIKIIFLIKKKLKGVISPVCSQKGPLSCNVYCENTKSTFAR